jgi:competence protein ComGC
MDLTTYIAMVRAMFTPKTKSADNGYATLVTVLIVLACVAVLIFIIKNLSVHTK